MTDRPQQSTPEFGRDRLARIPALPFVFFFAAGILIDRQLSENTTPLPLIGGLGLLLILLVLWGAAWRRQSQLASGLIWAVVVCAGGVWHHLHWSVLPENHIRQYARAAPAPFDLQAVVETAATLHLPTLPRYASARPAEKRTTLTARVQGFYRSGQFTPAEGRVAVTVAGDRTDLLPGQTVRMLGELRRITPPTNPAGYHFADAQRQQQILCAIFCESPEAVIREPAAGTDFSTSSTDVTASDSEAGGSSSFPRQNWLDRLRRTIRDSQQRQFTGPEGAVAAALLLGERGQLDDATRADFQESGLMHLLSISGLHVGLVALLMLLCGRLANLSRGSIQLLTVGGMTVCLLLAEVRPPILRAWVIGLMVVCGWQFRRNLLMSQRLALAGGLVLLLQPGWLFDAGAQLSFLALIAIQLTSACFPVLSRSEPEQSDAAAVPPLLTRWSRWLLRVSGQSLLISLGITLLVLPLLGMSFHRVTLAGIPATLLSLPVLAVTMGLLLLHAAASFVSAGLAGLIAVLTAPLLSLLLWLADRFAGFTWLTWPSSRPDPTMIAAVYLLAGTVLAGLWLGHRRPKPELLLAWTLLVIALFEVPGIARRWGGPLLECRVLSIGHGNACLVAVAGGPTLLLDAGSMENGKRAADVILASLADLQRARIDAIFISHTDSDHLNAVPFLLEKIPVRQIFLNAAGLDPNHPGMRAIVESASARNVRLATTSTGDEFPLARDTRLVVLQGPAAPGDTHGNDNADSLVLELRAGQRKLLFPGDVSDAGQQQLMQLPTRTTDLLLAPHHGGRRENTREFAEWANPRQVIVSSGFATPPDPLRTIYGDECPLWWTAAGAVRVQVGRDQAVNVTQWAPGQSWCAVRSSE